MLLSTQTNIDSLLHIRLLLVVEFIYAVYASCLPKDEGGIDDDPSSLFSPLSIPANESDANLPTIHN